MDPSQLLREARRHAGYSQRHLAAVSGLSLRTVVDVEMGRRRVSAAALDALIGACGLDLTLCPRLPGTLPAGRDDGGRRAPAHRDPDEQQEGVNLSRSLTYAMDFRRIPHPTDSRGWRLDAPVSLRQWHEENGHPPRRGSRRKP